MTREDALQLLAEVNQGAIVVTMGNMVFVQRDTAATAMLRVDTNYFSQMTEQMLEANKLREDLDAANGRIGELRSADLHREIPHEITQVSKIRAIIREWAESIEGALAVDQARDRLRYLARIKDALEG